MLVCAWRIDSVLIVTVDCNGAFGEYGGRVVTYLTNVRNERNTEVHRMTTTCYISVAFSTVKRACVCCVCVFIFAFFDNVFVFSLSYC